MQATAAAPVVDVLAVVVRVVDGDTVVMNVNLATKPILGFDLWAHGMLVRLAKCNAREFEQPGGPQARDNLATRLPEGTSVRLRIAGRDEYRDRVDALVFLPDGSDLVAELVAQQWLAPWNGRGVKPVPPWPRTAAG